MATAYIYTDMIFTDIFLALSLLGFGHVISLIAIHGKAPALAFIGVSTRENSELQNAALGRFLLLGTSSLLDFATQTSDFSPLRATQSIVRTNTPNDDDWRLSVRDICGVAKVIIIDARAYSDIVDEEVTWLVQSENIDKALVILDKEEIYAGNKATPYRALQPYSDIVMDEYAALSEASLRLRGKPHESQSSTSLGTQDYILSEEAPLSEASLAIQAKSSANQNKKGLSTKGFAIFVAALGILTASSSLLSMIDDTVGWLGVFRHALSVYVNNVRWFFQHAFSFVGISLPSWIADYLAIGISNFGFTNSQSYWHNGRSHAAQIIDGILNTQVSDKRFSNAIDV